MEKTIFEKIIDGEIPSYKIYEDEYVYSFLDVFPITKGHTLVIPKNLAVTFWIVILKQQQISDVFFLKLQMR